MKISTALLVIAAFLVVCDIAAAQTVREVFEVEKKSFWSGTEGLYLTDQVADLLNVPNRQTGWILKSVAKGSPADELGLRGATTIVRIAGQDVPRGGDIV